MGAAAGGAACKGGDQGAPPTPPPQSLAVPTLQPPPSMQAEPQKSKGVRSPKSQSKSSLMPSPSSRPK